MKKLFGVAAIIALLSGMAAQAVTVQENFEFPDINVIQSQLVDESQVGIRDLESGANDIKAVSGQTFTLDSSTTVRAITLKSQGTYSETYFDTGAEILDIWIGANNGTVSNNVSGATNLLTSVSLANTAFTAGNYYTFNLDSDVVLPAGDYSFQFQFQGPGTKNQWFVRRANGSATNNVGGLVYTQTTDGSPVDFPLDATVALGNDLVFGLHSTVVGMIPTVVQLSSDEIVMSFAVDLDGTDGSTSIGYSTLSGSSVVVSSISMSDESHANAFSSLSVLPLVLNDALPTMTSLAFNFDNTIAGLVADEVATATATIDWFEEGVTNGQFMVSLSATALESLPESSITNTGAAFPTDNVLVAQDYILYNGQAYLAGTSSVKLGSGQTFTLDGNKTVTGFTVYVSSGKSFDAGTHRLNLWVGSVDGTTAGDTALESFIDLSSYNLQANQYHRIDFAEEINLKAGTYGVQVAWESEDANHSVRLGNTTTNVYDGGTGQRFNSDGTLPIDGGAFAWDLVFAVHGVDGPEGYDGWLLDYDLGIYTNMTDNPDGDAYNNLYEYAFGGNPTNGADIGYRTPQSYQTLNDGSTNWFEYVYARRIAASNEVVYALEMTDNLVSPNWMLGTYVEVPETGTMPEDAAFETVTNLVDMTGKNVEFIRVDVTEQP